MDSLVRTFSLCLDFAIAHPIAAAFMAASSAWILLGFTQARN